MKIALFIFIP